MNVVPESTAVPDSYHYEWLYYCMAKTVWWEIYFGRSAVLRAISQYISFTKTSQCDVIVFGWVIIASMRAIGLQLDAAV